MPATVGDCLQLRSQLTTDAYTLTLSVNSMETTLVLSHLSSTHRALIFTLKDRNNGSLRVLSACALFSTEQTLTESIVSSAALQVISGTGIHSRV